jgi:hypothetical protein
VSSEGVIGSLLLDDVFDALRYFVFEIDRGKAACDEGKNDGKNGVKLWLIDCAIHRFNPFVEEYEVLDTAGDDQQDDRDGWALMREVDVVAHG